MVDRADLTTVNNLIAESQMITRAINNFDEGGRITAFVVGPDLVSIPSGYIPYPPQMVDTIKQAISERRDQIQQELSELGLTGEEPEWSPPEGEQAPEGGEPPEPQAQPAQQQPAAPSAAAAQARTRFPPRQPPQRR